MPGITWYEEAANGEKMPLAEPVNSLDGIDRGTDRRGIEARLPITGAFDDAFDVLYRRFRREDQGGWRPCTPGVFEQALPRRDPVVEALRETAAVFLPAFRDVSVVTERHPLDRATNIILSGVPTIPGAQRRYIRQTVSDEVIGSHREGATYLYRTIARMAGLLNATISPR